MKKAKYIKPMTITFAPDAFDAIKEIADREEESMSEVVRRFVEEGLQGIQQDPTE
jgi:predicted CopG family antitoxin